MSEPPPAAAIIALDIAAKAAPLVACSAARAAGAPGVPAAALVAVSAAKIAASEVAFAACNPAAAASGIPRQAGINPMRTVILPGPGVKTGGNPWATLSIFDLAAGPVGIKFISSNFRL
jgi:hypothetical protein